MAALSNSGLESATYFSDTVPALSNDNFMNIDTLMLGDGALGRPRGRVWGGGGGRGVQDGGHGCTCGRFISMFGGANTIL